MSYQVLARKWRPKTFPAMVGQEHVLRALINALDNDRLHHAYLFTGTRGVGKTTVARIFAKSLNCEQGITSQPCGTCSACTEIDQGRFVDLIEVDAASRTKVEDTRELLENVQYSPTRGRYKVYLIDEVHMLSTHSFNALLKTLEEPPPHVKFLLATTDPQKLPVTILSRCLQFSLKRMSPEMIIGHLEHVLGEEGIAYDAPALRMIAEGADGSMRDALSLLDQAIAYGGGGLAEAEVRAMLGTIDRSYVFQLLQHIANADAVAVLETVNQLAQQGVDFAAVLAELLSQLHRVALAQVAPDAINGHPDETQLRALAAAISSEDVQLYYQIGLIGRRDLPYAPDGRSGFEMVVLRMLAFQPVLPPTGGGQAPKASSPVRPAAAPTNTASAAPAPRPEGVATSPAAGLAQARAALKGNAAPARAAVAEPEPTPQYSELSPPPHTEASMPYSSMPDWDEPDAPMAPAAPVRPAPANPVPPTPAVSAPMQTTQAAPRPAAGSRAPDLPWPELVSRLGLKGMAAQLAANCVMTGRDGQQIQLSIDAQHATLRSAQLESRLQEALSGYFGETVRLQFSVAASGVETPALLQQRDRASRQQAAVDEINNDPDLGRIREAFNAQVVPDSIQPTN